MLRKMMSIFSLETVYSALSPYRPYGSKAIAVSSVWPSIQGVRCLMWCCQNCAVAASSNAKNPACKSQADKRCGGMIGTCCIVTSSLALPFRGRDMKSMGKVAKS